MPDSNTKAQHSTDYTEDPGRKTGNTPILRIEIKKDDIFETFAMKSSFIVKLKTTA
jgi:hypothetical protein